MQPQIDDWEDFEVAVSLICAVYAAAAYLYARGVNVVSVDEKTGMQANQAIRPPLPTKPGRRKCVESEYKRHGVTCLTANKHVATGKVIFPTMADTRTSGDFVGHIARTVASAPTQGWIFVLDNLNTHWSSELCIWVEKELKLEIPLGVKGKSGILKNKESRQGFLSDPDHRIQFIYTPKHCSWLNQIEVWFSTLQRRLLRGASFDSKEHLQQRVTAFIEQYNERDAKPYKWTCKPEEVVEKVWVALNSTVT